VALDGLFCVRTWKHISFLQSEQRFLPVWFPSSGAHLQSLDEELTFDHSANSGFEIAKLRTTAPLFLDPLQHVVDLGKEVGFLTDIVPNLFHGLVVSLGQRPVDRPCASQSMDFPELRTVSIIRLISWKRRNERSLFSVGPKPRIE